MHDFAWTASPGFVEVTDRWEHVLIRDADAAPQVAQARTVHPAPQKPRSPTSTRHVGRYPYPVLTIVDPAHNASEAARDGVSDPDHCRTHWAVGEWQRLPELVVVHELGHNYWYGMVANNESEEAWLDEGLTQYYETRIMDETYGTKTSVLDLAGLRIGDFEVTREGYLRQSEPEGRTDRHRSVAVSDAAPTVPSRTTRPPPF